MHIPLLTLAFNFSLAQIQDLEAVSCPPEMPSPREVRGRRGSWRPRSLEAPNANARATLRLPVPDLSRFADVARMC